MYRQGIFLCIFSALNFILILLRRENFELRQMLVADKRAIYCFMQSGFSGSLVQFHPSFTEEKWSLPFSPFALPLPQHMIHLLETGSRPPDESGHGSCGRKVCHISNNQMMWLEAAAAEIDPAYWLWIKCQGETSPWRGERHQRRSHTETHIVL